MPAADVRAVMPNAAAPFAHHARSEPRALALSGWGVPPVEYGALADAARRCAGLLQRAGVAPGDRVAILLPNDAAYPVALLGTLWLGAVAVAFSPTWAASDLRRALANADARLLVTTESLAVACNAHPDATILVDTPGTHALARRLARATPGSDLPAHCAADAPAAILYSSGTTSQPKGVVLTHGNLAFNARSKARYCGITPRDRLALVVPVSHCFGQNVVLLGALSAGASVHIAPRFDAEHLRHAVEVGAVSLVFGTPTVFRRLLDARSPDALRSLRYALSAAAPLDEELATRWRDEQGTPLHQGYGQTECSPFATYQDGGAGYDGSVGRAIDGVALRIADGSGVGWAASGEPGEVSIRGPNVMQGYWRDPAATARALRGGWLRTGDVGVLDATGRLSVLDRIDDVINVSGFKVHPSDVERALRAHPSVRDACVYGVPHAERGASVVAAVVLRQGAVESPETLAHFAAARLGRFQQPHTVRVVPELPRSASGKLLRRVLRDEPMLSSAAR